MTWLYYHWHYALAAFVCGMGGGLIGGLVGARFSYWYGYRDGARIAHEYMRAMVERQSHN